MNIPNSVTAMGEYTFYGCDGLTSVVIPNSVKVIDNSVFRFCESLTSVTLPNTITSIGDYAFTYCSKLPSIDIPASVTYIGESAFADCSKLTSIDIPKNVTVIGDYAFEECTSLLDVYSHIKSPAAVEMGEDVFYLFDSYVYRVRTLHVPAGTVATYQADNRWSDYFRKFDEMQPDVIPGDVNSDGNVNISDVNSVIEEILNGDGNNPAADVNGDGNVNISDVNAIIAIILK